MCEGGGKNSELLLMAHTCNKSTQEAEMRELCNLSQPGLHADN